MKDRVVALLFSGGGVILTAQTPYDREVLADYVLDCARRNHNVRLAIGRETWRVEARGGDRLVCSQCHRPLPETRCYASERQTVTCVRCTLKLAHARHRIRCKLGVSAAV
jgi:hypothetical protein